MKFILLSILVILAIQANAQIEWGGHKWEGNSTDYAIESDGGLGLESVSKESPAIIYSKVERLDSVATWTIDVSINTTTSNSNMMRLYLGATDKTLSDGLFVAIGNNEDNVCLCKTKSGVITNIIIGKEKLLDYKTFKATITIERSLRADGSSHFEMTTTVDAEDVQTTDTGEGDLRYEDTPKLKYLGAATYFTSTRKSGAYIINSFVTKEGLKHIDGEMPPAGKPSTGTEDASIAGWKGMTHLYRTDKETKELELHADSVVSPAIIYKHVEKLDTVAEWQFDFTMNNTISSSNTMRVYLAAADSTLDNGINVVFGSGDKNICLANCVNGTNKILIKGEEDLLAEYPQTVNVLVRRSMNIDGSYHYIMYTNTLTKTIEEECDMQAKDHPEENYIGIYTKYTSGRKTGTYFVSDIEMKNRLVKEETIIDVGGFYRGCVVISEVMVNASGELGLPDQEYIELYNTTDENILLLDWTIENEKTKGKISDYILPAGGYVTICGKTHTEEFSGIKNVAYATPWPTLSNSKGRLVLRNPHSKVADYMEYDTNSYGDSYKKDGGWSLERVDAYNISNENSNWKASENEKGGTPSEKNSIEATNIDVTAPYILSISSSKDGSILYVTTSEPIDTAVISNTINISGVMTEIDVTTLDDVTLSRFAFKLKEPIRKGKVYEVRNIGMEDYAGNKMADEPVRTAVTSDLTTESSIIINEIMVNASVASNDYIEIYNKGAETYDLRDVCFGVMKDDALKSCNSITTYSRPIYPGDYIVICNDSLKHIERYDDKRKDWVVGNSNMGNLATDGTIAITLRNGQIIDRLDYSSKMHSSLLSETRDVALERIITKGETNDPTNWTSAAEYYGYATPTAKNSQNRDEQAASTTRIGMKVRNFTPDGDGVDDEMIMGTVMGDGQWNVTMKIYSSNGIVVAVPYNNRPMPVSGELRWDGRADDGAIQGPGTYIIYVSAWKNEGGKEEYKGSCVISTTTKK